MASLYASKYYKISMQVSVVLKWDFSFCHQFFLVFPEIKDAQGSSRSYLHILAHGDLCPLRFPPCPSKAVFVALLTLP